MGVLQNVTYREGQGLFGDFHYNPKHALAEQLVWDAQHSPSSVGLSHDAEGKAVRRDGKVIVESITKVHSVDLVADPATASGLFEQTDEAQAKMAAAADDARETGDVKFLHELYNSATALVYAVIMSDEDADEKRAQIKTILSDWSKQLGSGSTKAAAAESYSAVGGVVDVGTGGDEPGSFADRLRDHSPGVAVGAGRLAEALTGRRQRASEQPLTEGSDRQQRSSSFARSLRE